MCFPHPRTLGQSQQPAAWKQQQVPDSSGKAIPFWRFQTNSPKGRLLICHGYFANRYQVQGIAARLAQSGFEVLVMELRGHGERPGPCTFGVRETADALAILGWAENQSGSLPIGLLGFSMGAAVMCQVAQRLPQIKAIVADSIYAHLFPVLCRGLWQERRVPAIPFAWVSWLGLQCYLGTSLSRLDPIHTAERSTQALLLIEGGEDLRVPRRLADSWYAQWAGNKERWCEPDTGHVGVFPKDPDKYVERVTRFFERMLR